MRTYDNSRTTNASILRRRQQLHRRIFIFLFTILLVAGLSITLSVTIANAQSPEDVTYKYYKSYMVENDDTLWTIATENCIDQSQKTISNYIEEVKQLNSLDATGKICYGSYLVIPYYSYEFH